MSARYQVQAFEVPRDSDPPQWEWLVEIEPPKGYKLHSWQAIASLYQPPPGRPFDDPIPEGGRASVVVLWERE